MQRCASPFVLSIRVANFISLCYISLHSRHMGMQLRKVIAEETWMVDEDEKNKVSRQPVNGSNSKFVC